MKHRGPISFILALSAVSCAGSKDNNESTKNDEALSPIVETTAKKLEVDATSRNEWVGLDLDQGVVISVQDLPSNGTWDLAFKRTSIKMNGEAVAMQVVSQDFSALSLAPKEGYSSDKPSTDPGAPETSGLAFHAEPAWYSYDINTHAVSSRGLTYAIQTNEGRFFKLKILDYYNAARLPAYLNLEYQELQGVAP